MKKKRFLGYLTTEKLPSETRNFWKLATRGTEPQTYDGLEKFLDGKCHALEAANLSMPPAATLTQPCFTTCQNSQHSFKTVTTQLQHQRRNIRSQLLVLQWHSQAAPQPEVQGCHSS